jgi:peptidoglycan hydrolase CwlO-like protein
MIGFQTKISNYENEILELKKKLKNSEKEIEKLNKQNIKK